jgi:tRNA U34 5-methylaminomethyl-2-thiouridine-forming methyltransferase MnmC
MNESKPLKFIGSLGEYELIETADGSATVYSSAFQEACHSNHGAIKETNYIYVEGCEIIKNNVDTVFEVGFGVGTGWQETIAIHDRFTFYSTELDEKLIYWAQEKFNLFDSLEKKDNYLLGKKKNSKAIILLGDARKTIHEYKFHKPFDAIYQDAFSPKRCPSLWTVEWFEDLLKLSSEKVVLSTYSASSRVKKALFAAGWSIEEREGFASKRSATRAFRKLEMDDRLILKLQNPKISPMRDSDLL